MWRGFAAQITRTTPLRRITLHFTQIFLTEARTFTTSSSLPGTKTHSTTERFAPFPAAPRLPPRDGWGLPGENGPVLITGAPRSVKEAGPAPRGGAVAFAGTDGMALARLPGGLSGAGSPP